MSAPAWSVVVPTYNRPHRLGACLAALGRLEPPDGGFEILVVNDGGSQPDPRLCDLAGTAADARMISQTHAGPAAARNRGAHAARGRWLAFTDDDCEPEPGWLLALERALGSQPDALAGGAVVNGLPGNILSEASQLLAGFTSSWFDGVGRERFFTSNNIAVARAAFLDAGGFDVVFGMSAGEDREFCDRWSARRLPTTIVEDAIVRHSHLLSPRSFLRQHFAYGRANALFRALREQSRRPVRIDPAFYLASLRHAAATRPRRRGAALAALTLVAHGAYLAGLACASLARPAVTPSEARAEVD